MRYREVAAKLAVLGCRELPRRGGGSHRKWLNPALQRAAVLPDDLKPVTVRAAVRQLGFEWQAFHDA